MSHCKEPFIAHRIVGEVHEPPLRELNINGVVLMPENSQRSSMISQLLRPYQPEDLPSVLTFLGECLRASNFCNFHPGDIAHWMSNEKRGKDLDKYYWLYEEDNELLAFAELLPVKSPGYTLIVHPQHRGGDLEGALLQHCETEMWQRMQDEGSKETTISISVARCDKNRIHCLTALEYHLTKRESMMRRRSLLEPIPTSVLPEGFSIRSIAGEHEAALLAEVHNSAFTPKWTAESYLGVMRSPSFKVENELVVVAPDGRFAAFLVYWLDPLSNSGLFEPVGCHEEFRQRGLTKALMLEGMKRMINAGMTTALVGNKIGNEAASRLYESLGLQKFSESLEYTKIMA
jgi:mycothiol synthase